MSNRTMLEFNHDYWPSDGDEAMEFGEALGRYMRSGDPSLLPRGVTWFGMRHHSEDCPLGNPPRGWDNEKPAARSIEDLDELRELRMVKASD